MTAASIRYNNPGAMWGGNALAKKWGATNNVVLHDGLGQGNTIAVFPDVVHGACAQFDLWRTSANYKNKTLSRAIQVWSGGNSWQGYVKFLEAHDAGLADNTVIDEAFLSSEHGWQLMKAQAWNEAGQEYPMTDAQWQQAQKIVFGGGIAVTPTLENATPLIRVGDGGAAVELMQKLLGCKITGHYDDGSETEYALRLFQARNGLTPDGRCGELTWNKLQPVPPT
jgi:murein L,D-transpeptidase YcbB/YkuD